MATLDELTRQVADLRRRVTALEVAAGGGGGTGVRWGPNVLINGDIESGLTNWARLFWTGTIGAISVETGSPLSGTKSLKLTEAASSSTRVTYVPTGSTASPTVGVDVFPTNGGDQWLLTCTLQSTVATTHAKIYAACGDSPANCYGLIGANTTWVAAADIPLTAGVTTTLYGIITVPDPRNYLTVNLSPDDASAASGVGWSWLVDDISLQQRIN